MTNSKRILGIDFGKVRIGTAISDPLGITAQPLIVITRKNLSADIEEIIKIIKNYGVEKIVLGLPITLKGEKEIAAKKVEEFAKVLENKAKIPIIFYDERLSTKQAQRVFRETNVSAKKQRQSIDKISAAIILQNYMEKHR